MTIIAGIFATLGLLALESEHKERLEKGYYDAQSRDHQLNELDTGDDLTIITGGDLSIGVAKDKVKGNTQFTTGDAITVVSEQDFRNFDLDFNGKEGGKHLKNQFRQQLTEVTTNKTTVKTGGNLSMHAQGGDLTFVAVETKSGCEMHLMADQGQIELLTTKDQDFKDTY